VRAADYYTMYTYTVIGALIVDRCAVTFGTLRSGLGLGPAHSPSRCTNCNSSPYGQYTNFILFDVVL